MLIHLVTTWEMVGETIIGYYLLLLSIGAGHCLVIVDIARQLFC